MTARVILISNETTSYLDVTVSSWVAAVQEQVTNHFAPAYSGLGSNVQLSFWPKSNGAPPKGQEIIHVQDDSDQADVLGEHEVNPAGYPEGFVFAVTTANDGNAPSGTLSHETLEQVLDPYCILTVPAHLNGLPVWVIGECADPDEDTMYTINGVVVSNFVLPEWFTGSTNPAGKVDYLGHLSRGFQIGAGGYVSYMSSAGQWNSVFGRKGASISATVRSHNLDPKYSRKGRYRLMRHYAARGIKPAGYQRSAPHLAEAARALKILPHLVQTVDQVLAAARPLMTPLKQTPLYLTP